MPLCESLHLQDMHSIAICGAGGKTTLLYALAEELRRENKAVLVTTSTHMFQPEETGVLRFFSAEQIDFASICKPRQISVFGTPCEQNKITGIAPMDIDTAMHAADVFLYEADGSKHLPVKCHNATEPVIWFGTDAVVCVLGLSALGKPAQESCHRWQLDPLFAALPDKLLQADDFVRLALECRKAAGYPHCFSVCLNQCDTDSLLNISRDIAAQLAIHGISCAAACFLGSEPQITPL